MYRINIDAERQLVEVELAGMMSVDEVDRYIEELKRAFVRHRLREWRLLLDITACPIQQQEMLHAMGRHMATMPKASAIAVITGSSLAKMQVRRLFTQPYARIVANAAEGRAWILSGEEPAGW